MIGSLLTVFVDGYAALDRATQRRAMLIDAAKRVEWYSKRFGSSRSLLVVNHPNQMRHSLSAFQNASCVVFVDCALELCDDEADLMRCWHEIKRVAGSYDSDDNENCITHDIFVLRIQSWATGRATFDPRVRWILTSAPDGRTNTEARLQYRPYGRRSTALGDVRIAGRIKAEEARVAAKTRSERMRG